MKPKRYASTPLRTILGPSALVAAAALPAGIASAQESRGEAPPFHVEAVSVDSGWRRPSPDASGLQVVWTGAVAIPDARWLRLSFETLALAGDSGRDDAPMVRLTSMEDGAVQMLDAEAASRWSNTSAYFNGDAVFVELLMHPGADAVFGPSRVRITSVTAGDAPSPFSARTICGPSDDRELSSDPRVARILPSGCTGWLINDFNQQFLSAGHCGITAETVCEFNVPVSNADGSLRHPPPEDQYPAEQSSIQNANGGIGNDFCYFGCWPNTVTNQFAGQRQGQTFTLPTHVAGPTGSEVLRVSGFGVAIASRNQSQQTATGAYSGFTTNAIIHTVDTTGGNSGSPILNEATGFAIGIHTNGGCDASGGTNYGTSIDSPPLRAALASPRGICSPGFGLPVPPVYAAGDAGRSFGTVDFATGSFGWISTLGFAVDGMAYDPIRGVFWVVSTDRRLARINPSTGAQTVVGTLTGTSRATSGLAFDPETDTLYGIITVGGRLVRINTTTAAVTALGAPGGNNVAGLDFDIHTRTIFGIDDSSSGSRLIRINAATGAQTVVGLLGEGIVDCNGLAYNPADRTLYMIHAQTEELLAIDPSTGVARVVGPSATLWGGNYGLACVYRYGCDADFNGDGFVDFFDYDDFVGCFEGTGCGTGSADFNGDGFVDFFDYDDYVAAFETGC